MAKRKRQRKRKRKLIYDQAVDGRHEQGPADGKRYFSRLANAIEQGRKDLAPFRANRVEAVRQYVGSHYSDDGTTDRQPLGMIELGVSIITRHLVAQAPEALVTSKVKEYKTNAYELGLALHEVVKQIKLADTLREWVFNGMFGLSVVKVGLAKKGEVETEGAVYDAMGVYAAYVDLDDWVHDTTARTWKEMQFMGHRHRVPYDYFMESGVYNKKDIADVSPSSRELTNEHGDMRMETLTFHQSVVNEPYREWVELYDIWLPGEQIVVSMVDQGNLRPVREIEWTGPENGPYRPLVFNPVPRSVMPLAPVSSWMDLHMLVNAIYRKSANQALRQKDVTVFQGSAAKDAERIRDSTDGEMVRVDAPEKVKTHKFGGADQVNFAFGIHAKDQFTYMAGNLDSLGGLSPQADTLGQDRMLSSSASKRIADMQDKVETGTHDILRDIAWYMWDDPLSDIPITKRLAGDSFEMLDRYTQDNKGGDFFDYVIDIVPYSMQFRSPGERLEHVKAFLRDVAVPLAPQMGQQGIGLDFRALVDLFAKYGNLTELKDILTSVEPDNPLPGERPRQSAQTTRTNVRVNRPGATSEGKDAALIQNLAGGGIQPNESASQFRSTG